MAAEQARTPPTVLTVTVNPALDVSLTVDHLIPDQKLRARDNRREAGGGGVNVARVLGRFGVPTRALTVAGGPTGAELVALLDREGLDTAVHPIDEATRESMAITEASTGRQYRLSVPGPTVPDAEALHRFIVDQAAGVGLVVLSGGPAPGLPPDVYPRILDALAPDTITIVDCGPPALAAVTSSPGRPATLVKPSQKELALLVGWEPASPEEIEQAATEVLAQGGVEAVVASRGPSGAVLVTGDGPPRWFRPPPVHPVSTVGAGDSMVAGMAHGLAAGRSLEDAVRLGVAAGTAAVLTPGTELCHVADVERFVDQVVVPA